MKEQKGSLKDDLIFLFLKIIIFLLLGIMVFRFVFGVFRCNDDMMYPAVKAGDLAVFYRLQKEYQPSNVVVVEKNGEKQIRRVIAMPGDEVDITSEGLLINGYLQQEAEIFTDISPYVNGIEFPILVGEDEYFVLGDNRINAKDSRIYGTVKKAEIKGVVMTLIRRRGF